MYRKMESMAMLLAGGQGSRLGVLTKNRAKPAVPFGGKYRIIDFTLSNCINSGLSTVGVLTQYQPLELNEYIGNGQPWDLDRLEGGVHVLPPFQKRRGSDWYKGTANAIFQNISFIERYDPEYVVILSGDHIYKMDYSKMIDFHKESNADCTISVIEVPIEEASRFGIMNADQSGRIFEFEEKPKKPKSNKASMGVYTFTWKKLRRYLELDEGRSESHNDFGKDIIPAMLGGGERVFAYPFTGYWKDVGTIESLWEANMDLLKPDCGINLADTNWKIYSRSPVVPPHFIGLNAKISNSLIAEGCCIDGEVYNSVIFSGVNIAKGAVVRDSIIMPGASVFERAKVQKSVVAEEAEIGADSIVGFRADEINKQRFGITVIGDGVHIGRKSIVMEATMLDTDMPEVKAV
ncbi:MAG TPA: glucose-1-phosphate adenylyltransferase [Ruminiclostridium sp.]|nr:glucose-1-phosphate adenylyltransferase [Ruminiclostridium sp.]